MARQSNQVSRPRVSRIQSDIAAIGLSNPLSKPFRIQKALIDASWGAEGFARPSLTATTTTRAYVLVFGSRSGLLLCSLLWVAGVELSGRS